MKKILIVGAGGQIGSELTTYLRSIYGDANVVASDMRESKALGEAGPFELLDALDAKAYAGIVSKYKIDSIFNLVALLSATGEKIPQKAWEINIGALMNSLEIARENNCALFTPSSIGAFGPSTPKDKTPQDTLMRPTTIYGVCKVTGELLGDYYHTRFGVDTVGCLHGYDVYARCAARLCRTDGSRPVETGAPQQLQYRFDELYPGDHLRRGQKARSGLYNGL